MKNKLFKTSSLVKSILERDKQARNSDNYLYIKVLETAAEKAEIDIKNMSIISFLYNANKLGLPPFETVRRTRQKIQEKHPELSATKEVQDLRAEQENEYRAYALSEVV